MSERLLQTCGFTQPIDCGVVPVRMFDPSYLEKNIAHGHILSNVTFDPGTVPCLQYSHLTLLHEGEGAESHVQARGRIDFAIPMNLVASGWYTEAVRNMISAYMKDTCGYLSPRHVDYAPQFYLWHKSQPSATIELAHQTATTMTMDVTLYLGEEPSYKSLEAAAYTWGHLHNAIAGYDQLTSVQSSSIPQAKIIFGDAEYQSPSEVEVAVETRREKIRQLDLDIPLPIWGSDIDSAALRIFEAQAGDSLDAVADQVFRDAWRVYRELNTMPILDQSFIVNSIHQALLERRQSHGENTHRD